MSRSGYDDAEASNLWLGAVKSAIRGKRGQALLRELRDSMDAMAVKELIADELVAEGSYCALGVVGQARGIAIAEINPEDIENVSKQFDIADALAREIVYQNDEAYWRPGGKKETPAERWVRVRAWVQSNIAEGGAA